jgi:hypothetical protein
MNLDPGEFTRTFTLPDGDETPIHLREELDTFDYNGFFERAKAGTLSYSQKREYTLRLFCHVIRLRRDKQAVPDWALDEIAQGLRLIAQGHEWETVFPLPWTTPTPPDRATLATRRRNLGFCVFQLVANNEVGIEEAKRQVAEHFSVSIPHVEDGWKEFRERWGLKPPYSFKKV